MSETAAPAAHQHFIAEIVEGYLAKHPGATIVTRFPPEPNGYLHIGHAKSICLNFGLARTFGGNCHLRMDDTNPTKEEVEYVDSIQQDVRWLGFQWHGPTRYASGYFDQIYAYAVQLITQGDAYVCDLTQDEIGAMRGTPTEPARPSPFRERSVAENLDLFARMKAGEFADGVKTVRAKIDLASPNMHMRDPVIYRIRHAHHHQTGDAWCVYPMYDYAHCLSDAIEGITHSICTLEFEVHRPLYDWILQKLNTFPSHQYEFSRLHLTYTVMSKRKLLELVKDNHVAGWDDPRLPTISGLRRRGLPAAALRRFCEVIGVTKFNGVTDYAVLENAVRESLNKTAPRFMAVFHPLKVVLTNWPADRVDMIESDINPEDPSAGSRQTLFARELFIERDDFLENPPKKFFRLSPGGEVRLRHGYVIRCDEVVKDAEGNITELRCTCDLETKSGTPGADAKKVKGVIHWVPAVQAVKTEVRLYDRLFTVPEPDSDKERDFKEFLNPDSLKTVPVLLEPAAAQHLAKVFAQGGGDGFAPEVRCQFERVGYFMLDPKDNVPGKPLVFNRIVTLKDSWAKESAKA